MAIQFDRQITQAPRLQQRARARGLYDGIDSRIFRIERQLGSNPSKCPWGHARSWDRLAMTARLVSCVHPRANSAELGVEFVLADTLLRPLNR
jgi:hypothetical protein